MQTIKDAWAGLDTTGRTVLVICVAAVIIAMIGFGVNIDWAAFLMS